MVLRAGVARQISQAGMAKVVLVRAPAGFGKTTAMLQAYENLRASEVATAWLTLDSADNDVPRFLSCLTEAVSQLQFDARTTAASIDVIDVLAREGSAFTLFLDDFEVLKAPTVLGLIRQLVEHLPRGGQLVIGSRSLPDLGLGRLRAHGQLAEIDVGQLRFTLDEAAEYLRLRGFADLSLQTLAQLHVKTEGWIAALWLASLALDRHASASDYIERFSGSDRSIADYLAEDVLANQPADVREFLLHTSILRHLNAPLCQSLLPGMDCARLLDQIEASNIFLSPIDGEVRSYRYHSLFAEFLRAQLVREHPDQLSRLHLAACRWYESVGRPVPAIDHAIEGGDHRYALTLLSEHAQGFLEQGRMRLLARWFAALPVEALGSHPRLQVVSLWAQCFTQGPWEPMARLDSARYEASSDPVIQAHVNALRPLLLGMMDRYDDSYVAGQASLSRLPSALPFADCVLSNAMAHTVSVLGHRREAHDLLDTARSLQKGSVFNQMYAESTEGMVDLVQGRLRQATARLRIAVSSTTHSPTNSLTNGNAWAGVAYASVVYEVGDFDLAERLLTVYLPLARDVGLPDHMISSHKMSARILFHRGDIDGGARLLTELEHLGHHRQVPRVVASAKLERARMLLLQGNAQASRDELNRSGNDALWKRVSRQYLPAHDVDDLMIGELRWDIHFGNVKSAVARLEDAITVATQATRLHRSFKLRVLLSIALWRSDQREAGVRTLEQVLLQTSREGFVRLILDEGPAVANLVHDVNDKVRGVQPYDPILIEYLQRLVGMLGPRPPAEEASGHDDLKGPVEPLKEKEMRVLKLLAEGYSNAAMAEKLIVSDSTVRSHLRNINMKLGAESRTHAVALARRFGLIR